MRFKAFRLLIATACVMAVATVALAAGPNWTDLSEAQQQKYMSLHDDFIQNTTPLRDAMWAKKVELNALMNNENVDAKKVAALATEMNKLRAEMRAQRATFAATVKKEVGIEPLANPHRGNMGYGCPGYGPNNGCGYGGKGMGKGMMRGKGMGQGMMRGHGPCGNMPMQAPMQAPAQ
ncbi:Spy/CpxP family protein refolding chaperone [Halodesulfovibrio marinisediminis]|uniref:Heavy-metal resistance n=1 Tax=Halodesulfovibrio marinisediminis DSM 17456 TaxID=1121457 RepID=A0A1N6EWE7_9BACT|nr:periplasmic heavy metal sensor [Halodesulfovibrio marinisediminis]SIN87422.1 Heavy-metal resistance [Halodesulfovibrio marinisediminis DSM 17456]